MANRSTTHTGKAAAGDDATVSAQALRAKIKARRKGAKGAAPEDEAREVSSPAPTLDEAEEHARREAEERAAEAQAQLLREQQEALAREQAEADARRAAELHARQQAELLAQQQEQAERERREAEEQARREAAEGARQEAEALALRKAEEQSWREAEERTRRKREETARKRAQDREAARDAKAGPGFLYTWGKLLALGLLAVSALGLVAVHLISFDGQIPRFEQLLAAQFGQPVKIGALRLSLLPHSQLRLEHVSIGAAGQIEIPRITASGALGNLYSDKKRFTALELDSPRIGEEALAWILFGTVPSEGMVFGRLDAQNASIVSTHLGLPPFAATLQPDDAGAWKAIVIETADKTLRAELTRQGESVQIEFTAHSFKLPFGSALTLDEMVAKGTATRAGLDVTEFKGFVQGGVLGGSAALKWEPSWSLAGQLAAQRIDAARLVPALFDGARVDGAARYVAQAPQAAQLLAAPRLEGNFSIVRGMLLGVDLERMMQGGAMSGNSLFTGLNGSFVHERGATQLRQLSLNQGSVTATGMADADAAGNLQGRITASLRLFEEQRSAKLGFSGTRDKIEWRR